MFLTETEYLWHVVSQIDAYMQPEGQVGTDPVLCKLVTNKPPSCSCFLKEAIEDKKLYIILDLKNNVKLNSMRKIFSANVHR